MLSSLKKETAPFYPYFPCALIPASCLWLTSFINLLVLFSRSIVNWKNRHIWNDLLSAQTFIT